MNVSSKKIGLGVVALAVVLMGSVAIAEKTHGMGKHGKGGLFGGIGPSFDFAVVDADQNGTVTPEELATYRAAQVTALDTNSDGFLSAEELTAMQSAAAAERAARKAAHLTAELDTNADGQLSTAELIAKPVPENAFGRADTNADGVLDQTEATAAADRSHGPDGHRGPRGQGNGAEPTPPAN